MNIPIYRAKEKDKNEYVQGYLFNYTQINILGKSNVWLEAINIDINTLSIHFSNMLDKNDRKIFASLNEDGIGGDILEWKDMKKIAKYSKEDSAFILIENNSGGLMNELYCNNFRIIGIEE